MALNAVKFLTGIFGRQDHLRRPEPGHSGESSTSTGGLSSSLLDRPTREDIRQCYRLILGREPESDQVIDDQMHYPSVSALRLAALKSVEFRGRYRAICAEKPDPYWSSARRALVLIHLEKTGGSTLRDFLSAQFDDGRVCPGPNNPLYSFSVAELGHYDFFAGHFDLDSVRYIPRQSISTLALFREPRSRLISWYRFHKSHPPHGEHATNRLVVLANQLTAEEFFELSEVRNHSLAYNRYLLAFGRSFSWYDHRRDSLRSEDLNAALKDAKDAVRSLTALGITERFDHSLRYICRALDQLPPPAIKSVNVTDDLPNVLSGFRRVDHVHMTPRLSKALDEITMYDEEIYRFAISEFERRCAESEVG